MQSVREPKEILVRLPEGDTPNAYLVEAGDKVVFHSEINLDEASPIFTGKNLVLTFNNHPDILLLNYGGAANASQPLTVALADGTELNPQDIIAISRTVETAEEDAQEPEVLIAEFPAIDSIEPAAGPSEDIGPRGGFQQPPSYTDIYDAFPPLSKVANAFTFSYRPPEARHEDDIILARADETPPLCPEGRIAIHGTDESETLQGTEADECIFGYGGNDILYGSSGSDYLNGGTGVDKLYGGAGNDKLVYDPNDSVIDGGGGMGIDTLIFNQPYGAINMNLFKGMRIEHLDFTNEGYDELHLTAADVFATSDHRVLLISGDEGDSVFHNGEYVPATGAEIEYDGTTYQPFINFYPTGTTLLIDTDLLFQENSGMA